MTISSRLAMFVRGIGQLWIHQKQNWMFSLVNRLVLACFILSVAVIAWKWKQLPVRVPLLRSLPWGADQLAHPVWLIMLPVSSLAWHSINVVISFFVTKDNRTFTQVLFLSSLFVGIISFITVTMIIFLVT